MRRVIFGKKKNKPFTLKVDTTKAGVTDSMSIQLPILGSNIVIDWGDNSTSIANGTITHTYSISGIYTISILSAFNKFLFQNSGDRLKLIEISSDGSIEVGTDWYNAFHGCANLITVGGNWENITSAVYMFRSCLLLKSLPDATFKNLTNGNSMFDNCNELEHLLSVRFNNLLNGEGMFYRNLKLKSLGSFFPKLNRGNNMFWASVLSTEYYSQLLIDMNVNNTNNNVNFHGGSSKYNSTALSARNNLISKGWGIIDNGMI